MTAAEAVRKARVPVLLFHGKADRLVPYEMSEQIADNCAAGCQLELFDDAGHGLSCLVDPVRYKAAVRKFCEECLW